MVIFSQHPNSTDNAIRNRIGSRECGGQRNGSNRSSNNHHQMGSRQNIYLESTSKKNSLDLTIPLKESRKTKTPCTKKDRVNKSRRKGDPDYQIIHRRIWRGGTDNLPAAPTGAILQSIWISAAGQHSQAQGENGCSSFKQGRKRPTHPSPNTSITCSVGSKYWSPNFAPCKTLCNLFSNYRQARVITTCRNKGNTLGVKGKILDSQGTAESKNSLVCLCRVPKTDITTVSRTISPYDSVKRKLYTSQELTSLGHGFTSKHRPKGKGKPCNPSRIRLQKTKLKS